MARESRTQVTFLILMSLTAAIGGFLFGYDTGVISSAILFIQSEYTLSSTTESLIVSIVALGAMTGALVAGPLSDALGRKKIVLSSSLIFILSALGLSLAPSVYWIIVGRFIVGFAIGVSSTTAPLYIAELSPRSMRGMLVTMNQLSITVGILASYLIGLVLSDVQGWRLMFGVAALPAAFQFLIMLFFPESPRWLAMNNQQELAKEVLYRFRGTRDDADLEFQHLLKTKSFTEASWREIFKSTARMALLAGIGLTIIQQVTGINTIIYFAPTIFKFAGFSQDRAAILAASLVGVVNVLFTFVALYLLDKVGRKPLLVTGLTGMVISLFSLGFGFLLPQSPLTGWISLVAMMFYIAFFAYSLGPIAWLINAEIYPLRVRGRAMGVATCMNWIANFAVTMTFLYLVNGLGKTGTFWLYGIIGLFGIWFILRVVPETKGRSLESIEDFFGKYTKVSSTKNVE